MTRKLPPFHAPEASGKADPWLPIDRVQMTFREIGERFGVSTDTVQRQHDQALKKLRKRLAAMLIPEIEEWRVSADS
jgi:hypothetical protein